MHCPYCKHKGTKVVDKRDNQETNTTRRRRECENCEKRFTTYERIENVLLYVKKRNGHVEEFDREKLKRSTLKALSKRNIPDERVEQMISEIEAELLVMDKDAIDSVEIGQIVLEKLQEVDELGALLFAAVYKEFKNIDDLKGELKRVADRRKK